jgi:hypothetical protein
MLEKDNYFLGTIFPYLKSLHYFGLNVPTFVENYPFGTIKSFKEDDVIEIPNIVYKMHNGV